MSYSRAFAQMNLDAPNNIPYPIEGIHYCRNAEGIPRDEAIQWWNPYYDNGYVYVAREFGMLEFEIDIEAVWRELVDIANRPRRDLEVQWSEMDWQLMSRAFDSLRAGYMFSARFLVPSFDLQTGMPFWDFLANFYRSMLLLGHVHVDNPHRREEDEEIYRIFFDEDGNEVVDLTGDGSTASTEPLTDVEEWELP